MGDLRELTNFLGLQISRLHDGLFISQTKYVLDLLEKFKMLDCKPTPTPFQFGVKLTKECTSKKVDTTLYRQLVGSLGYLTYSRQDICFAVDLVSRFMQEPRESHWMVAKRILRYVHGTMYYGVYYSCKSPISLLGFIDSD